MPTLIRRPAVARNPVSLLGAAIATAMAVLFLVLFLLDLLSYLANPYIGLLVFVGFVNLMYHARPHDAHTDVARLIYSW